MSYYTVVEEGAQTLIQTSVFVVYNASINENKDLMRQQLLIIALGFSCLIGITWIGTSIEPIIALLHPTKSIQTVQAGPYRVTLQIVPNPPTITQPQISRSRLCTRALSN